MDLRNHLSALSQALPVDRGRQRTTTRPPGESLRMERGSPVRTAWIATSTRDNMRLRRRKTEIQEPRSDSSSERVVRPKCRILAVIRHNTQNLEELVRTSPVRPQQSTPQKELEVESRKVFLGFQRRGAASYAAAAWSKWEADLVKRPSRADPPSGHVRE